MPENLSTGHFIAVIGLPFYFAGYLHIYRMLKAGNKTFARIVLAIGFAAFAVGGIWIGSRVTIGKIVHLQGDLNPDVYQNLIEHYTSHLEVLVQALRIIILALSVFFVIAILKGGTFYKRWMAIFNPITILLFFVAIGKLIPTLGNFLLPILMNVTHAILFAVSLYQLQLYISKNKP